EADVVDRQVGAGEQRRRDDERRRCGEVARHLDLAELQPGRRLDRHRRGTPPHARACGSKHQLSVVARLRGLDHRRGAVRVEAGEQNGRLHLRARDRQLVLDALQPVAALDDERTRRDARAHPVQRLGDAVHRAGTQRLVARELEASALAGQDAGQQSHQRSRVAAVDNFWGLTPKGGQTPAFDDELVILDVIDINPERSDRLHCRLRVAGTAEAAHARLAFAERADQHRAVGDRLVAGDGDVTDERSGRLDPHSSSTGDTTTWYPCASSTSVARAASSSPPTSSVGLPPRSRDMCCSSKSSMLIRSAPSACVIPASTPGRSGTCTRRRCNAPGCSYASVSMRRRLPDASAIQRARKPASPCTSARSTCSTRRRCSASALPSASALSRKMSTQMRGFAPATRVMSRSDPAAAASGSCPSMREAPAWFSSRFASAWGRWLVSATSRSCACGSTATGTAPSDATKPCSSRYRCGSVAATGGRNQVAPPKSSPFAPSPP